MQNSSIMWNMRIHRQETEPNCERYSHHRKGCRARCRHRRQLPRWPPSPSRLDRHGLAGQRSVAQSRRLYWPRVELHFSSRSQQGNGTAGRAKRRPVPRYEPVGRQWRHRSRSYPGAHGRAQSAHDLGQGVGDRGAATDSRRGEGTRFRSSTKM